MIENTPEQVANHYSACLDSVNLINALRAKPKRTDEENDTISRNVEHLKIMLPKHFWSAEDMTPIVEAVG